MGPLAALLLLAAAGLCRAEDAIHCPPCTEERLSRCRAPGGCEELVQEPGCGCCATCALGRGAPCGVYTPRCGANLRCYPPPGTEKPLHTLMHGQGLCTDLSEVEAIVESLEPTDGDFERNSLNPCAPHDRRCMEKHIAWTRMQIASSGRMRQGNSPLPDPRPMGSCARELHLALEKLAASPIRTQEDLQVIPIPNCDRDGNFHPKQCHPALDGNRGKCWCVHRETGEKITEEPKVIGDLDCQMLVESTRK
ncbi:insulin-like growth factor-binding protein 4 [Lissotriton helveticus]